MTAKPTGNWLHPQLRSNYAGEEAHARYARTSLRRSVSSPDGSLAGCFSVDGSRKREIARDRGSKSERRVARLLRLINRVVSLNDSSPVPSPFPPMFKNTRETRARKEPQKKYRSGIFLSGNAADEKLVFSLTLVLYLFPPTIENYNEIQASRHTLTLINGRVINRLIRKKRVGPRFSFAS